MDYTQYTPLLALECYPGHRKGAGVWLRPGRVFALCPEELKGGSFLPCSDAGGMPHVLKGHDFSIAALTAPPLVVRLWLEGGSQAASDLGAFFFALRAGDSEALTLKSIPVAGKSRASLRHCVWRK